MEDDYELYDMLEEAVDAGLIEEGSAAHGIAKRCIEQGFDELSSLQKATYNKYVLPHLKKIQTQREVAARIHGMPE